MENENTMEFCYKNVIYTINVNEIINILFVIANKRSKDLVLDEEKFKQYFNFDTYFKKRNNNEDKDEDGTDVLEKYHFTANVFYKYKEDKSSIPEASLMFLVNKDGKQHKVTITYRKENQQQNSFVKPNNCIYNIDVVVINKLDTNNDNIDKIKLSLEHFFIDKNNFYLFSVFPSNDYNWLKFYINKQKFKNNEIEIIEYIAENLNIESFEGEIYILFGTNKDQKGFCYFKVINSSIEQINSWKNNKITFMYVDYNKHENTDIDYIAKQIFEFKNSSKNDDLDFKKIHNNSSLQIEKFHNIIEHNLLTEKEKDYFMYLFFWVIIKHFKEEKNNDSINKFNAFLMKIQKENLDKNILELDVSKILKAKEWKTTRDEFKQFLLFLKKIVEGDAYNKNKFNIKFEIRDEINKNVLNDFLCLLYMYLPKNYSILIKLIDYNTSDKNENDSQNYNYDLETLFDIASENNLEEFKFEIKKGDNDPEEKIIRLNIFWDIDSLF
ncbi:hypothetical protein [Mycoplasma zalophi]|uniref:hypothetical protein n=1 Tax=Mycoplasma zalophi TaxID=191287 RepID=UPI001C10A570|nr:hypothetical protein [Mycoplasma zalophi]MBU4690907.1 hypothetical protein [Mycoplasma zalophi]